MDAPPVPQAPASRPRSDDWHVLREVLGISAPIIVAMASHTLMGAVDTLILGHYSRDAVAAGGAAAGLTWTLLAFIFGTATCTSTFVAQSLGRGTPEECARYTWQGIWFGVAAQALAFPFILGPGPTAWLAGLFGHEPSVLPYYEGVYLHLRMFHILGTTAYAALSAFFQGIGRPGIPMVAALIANVLNALLDVVMVFGLFGCPELGVAGAALATTLTSYLQAGLLLVAFLSVPMHDQFHTRTAWRFDAARLRRLLRIGSPAGLSMLLGAACGTVFTNSLIGGLGRDILAANNIVHQIAALSFMPAVGLHKGVSVLVGQAIGRRDIAAAKQRAYAALALAIAYMVPMGIVFFVFRGPLIRLFLDDPWAYPDLLAAGRTMLVFAALFQAFDAVGIVCLGALRGAGDTRFPALVSAGLAWGFMLPLGYLLRDSAGLGYVGVWVAAAIETALCGLLMLWRFSSEAWRKIDIFR
jgi:MATE family multidrug resistance protein